MVLTQRLPDSKSQTGDTIVEVLISIAIVSVVITGAYALANRGLQQGISASEHSQALKLMQGQVESLKFRQQQSASQDFLNDFSGAQPTSDSNFCLNPDSNSPDDTTTWGPYSNGSDTTKLWTLASRNDDPAGPYDPECVNNGKYYENISLPTGYNYTPGGSLPTYLITVRWNAIGGGQDQEQLYYRF